MEKASGPSPYSDAVRARLDDLAGRLHDTYQNNRPFSHIVIDDFLPVEVLAPVIRDYPSPEKLPWIRFDKVEEKKLAYNEVDRLPQHRKHFVRRRHGETHSEN